VDDALVFRSKIDWWLLTILMGAVVVCFAVAVEARNAIPEYGLLTSGLIIGACILGGALPLWIVFSTKYAMSDETLEIECGPFRWTVRIKDIEKIEATRNPLSSPALSLDRLRIDYGQGRAVMISPENRHQFLHQLEGRRKKQS